MSQISARPRPPEPSESKIEKNGEVARKTRPAFPKLALFGASPAFDTPLHVGRPNLGDRARLDARIDEMFERRWLSNNGPFVQEFEERLQEITGAEHCIAMCNGTIALEVVVRALGLSGEVIVPSFTFVATAHALRWHGITPVFADADPDTHNLDPAAVEPLITPRTTAIVGVHLWGRGCDTDALEALARRHDLRLVFDAAHAFGASHDGRMIGRFGDAEIFSFHATKFVNAFEGGAVATDDAALAERVRLMNNFGFAGQDNVRTLGTNGKMSEMSAAMGLTSLESMDEIVAANRRNYHAYRRALKDIPGLHVSPYDEEERCNYQYVIVEVDEETCGLSRDDLVEVLSAENVLARRYFYPGCHRMEPYCTEHPEVGERLPVTERLSNRLLALPTGTTVGQGDVKEIGHILSSAIEAAALIRRRLHPAPVSASPTSCASGGAGECCVGCKRNKSRERAGSAAEPRSSFASNGSERVTEQEEAE